MWIKAVNPNLPNRLKEELKNIKSDLLKVRGVKAYDKVLHIERLTEKCRKIALTTKEGKCIYVRNCVQAEAFHKAIYKALSISEIPVKPVKVVF